MEFLKQYYFDISWYKASKFIKTERLKTKKHEAVLWILMHSLARLEFYFFAFGKIGIFPHKTLWFLWATNKNGSITCVNCLYHISIGIIKIICSCIKTIQLHSILIAVNTETNGL